MSDATPAAETATAKAAAPKGKSKLKLIIIALVVVGLGVGGGVYAMRRPSASTQAEKSTSRGLVTFDPFVVNLSDPGGSRFIRVTLSLVVDDEKVASKITDTPVSMKEARSSILELLAEQNSAALVTADGKQSLKKAIIERVSAIFPDAKVTDVYFSEFVVQF
jgi:flagellar FliL protein